MKKYLKRLNFLSVPDIRGYLIREIRLKYALEISFLRDPNSRDQDEFNKYVNTLIEGKNSKQENVDHLFSEKEIVYFKKLQP